MGQQSRILERLSESINLFAKGDASLEEVQRDLEANAGVIESLELQNAIISVSNALDEYIHLYEVPEGERLGREIIEKLLLRISKYIQDNPEVK
jgi:hypothetical protein